VGPLANGHPAPPEFTFRTPLSPGPQLFDGTGHKQPSSTTLERLCCLDEERLERVCEFHGESSRKDMPGGYHRSGLVLFSNVPKSQCGRMSQAMMTEKQKTLAEAAQANPEHSFTNLYSLMHWDYWIRTAMDTVLARPGSTTAGIDGKARDYF